MTTEQLVSTLARKFRVDVEAPATTVPVTFTGSASTDNLTANAHGLAVGQQITVSAPDSGSLPTGITAGSYYVVAATTNTFKVSATSGGTPIDITADGSGKFVEAATWLQVRAVSGLKPTLDNTMEDDSDMDSDGWLSKTKTAMGWALELDLLRKVGISSNAYDPGQEIIRVAGESFGTAGVVHVRWYDRNGGPEAYEGYASVDWAPEGGKTTDLDKAKATLNGNGARLPITNPAAV